MMKKEQKPKHMILALGCLKIENDYFDRQNTGTYLLPLSATIACLIFKLTE